MRNYSALWMDHKHASLFNFAIENGALVKEPVSEKDFVADHVIQHHNRNPKDAHHEVKDHQLVAFFHKIVNELNDVEQLVVMGPGIAKSQFKHHCENHHHKAIAKAIVGIENMPSHPRKNEIVDKAREFFDSHK
jgi:stalled ribosome rescue protein Dom34